jgi:hypothetical protein
LVALFKASSIYLAAAAPLSEGRREDDSYLSYGTYLAHERGSDDAMMMCCFDVGVYIVMVLTYEST